MENIIKVEIEGFDIAKFIADFKEVGVKRIRDYALKEAADNIAMRIKNRMPEASGQLKRSLSIDKTNDGWAININSPYARLLNEGFKAHWVSQELISAHLSGFDTTFRTYRSFGTLQSGKRMSAGVFRRLGPPIMSTSKHKGFIMDAIVSADKDFENIIKRNVAEAEKRSATVADRKLRVKFGI